MATKPIPSPAEVRALTGTAEFATSNGAARPNFDPLNEKDLAEALKVENEDLEQRVKELLATADEWDAIAVIDNQEDAEGLTDFLTQMKNAWNTGDTRRDTRKRVYTGPADVVQKFFKKIVLDVLEPRGTALKKKLGAYIAKVNAEKAAAAKALADEARRKMEAATTAEETRAAAKDLKAAVVAGKATGLKTDFGSKVHSSTRWDFDVLDITKVPQRFLVVDRVAVMAYIGTGSVDKPVTIEGINVKRVSSTVI